MSDPQAALRDYADAFERGDFDAVVSFYEAPCLLVTPQGVTLFSDAAKAREHISRGWEAMRRDGYQRTDFDDLSERRLAEDLSALSGAIVRFRADGTQLNRTGLTYTLRRRADRWRIVSAIVHDPPPNDHDAPTAEEVLRRWADAFARGDIDAFASFYYQPCIYVMPPGVTVFTDPEVTRSWMFAGLEAMRAQGYHHTDFAALTTRTLAPELAAASGVFVRRRADGGELDRSGFTYTLRLAEGRWKIASAILHDPLIG